MNRTMLLILSSIMSAGSLFAGSSSTNTVVIGTETSGATNYEDVAYALPSTLRSQRELTIYQALATAITQTVVLAETRRERLATAEKPRKKVVVRGSRMTLSYSRNRYEQQCYLAVGPVQKWRTINGKWAARDVNARAIKRALEVLQRNGINVLDISLSVSDPHQVLEARKLMHRLGLGRQSLVGHDPSQPNHATITFNTN